MEDIKKNLRIVLIINETCLNTQNIYFILTVCEINCSLASSFILDIDHPRHDYSPTLYQHFPPSFFFLFYSMAPWSLLIFFAISRSVFHPTSPEIILPSTSLLPLTFYRRSSFTQIVLSHKRFSKLKYKIITKFLPTLYVCFTYRLLLFQFLAIVVINIAVWRHLMKLNTL